MQHTRNPLSNHHEFVFTDEECAEIFDTIRLYSCDHWLNDPTKELYNIFANRNVSQADHDKKLSDTNPNNYLQIVIDNIRAAADDLETLNNKPMAIEEPLSFKIQLFYNGNLVSTTVGDLDLLKRYRSIYTDPKYEIRVTPDDARSAEHLINVDNRRFHVRIYRGNALHIEATDATWKEVSHMRMFWSPVLGDQYSDEVTLLS